MSHFLGIGLAIPFSMGRLARVALGNCGDIGVLADKILGHAQGQEPLEKPFPCRPGKILLCEGFPDARSLSDEEKTTPFGFTGAGNRLVPAMEEAKGTGTDRPVKAFQLGREALLS